LLISSYVSNLISTRAINSASLNEHDYSLSHENINANDHEVLDSDLKLTSD